MSQINFFENKLLILAMDQHANKNKTHEFKSNKLNELFDRNRENQYTINMLLLKIKSF